MTAAALAVATPHYQWYSLLLVMLVALDGRPEWLAFAAGGYYAAYPNLGRYTPPWRLEDAIAYGIPLVIVAVGWLIRHELARRAGLGEPLPVMAEPVVSSGLTVLDVGEETVGALPQRPVPSREESRPEESRPEESRPEESRPEESRPEESREVRV